jgi:hypothetical protein
MSGWVLRMGNVIIEGYDCATQTSLINTPIDTSGNINSFVENFVVFGESRCSTDLSTYDYCQKGYNIRFTIKNVNIFNITKTKDTLSNNIKVLTKMYDAIDTFNVNDPNPFKSADVVNQPKPCVCYTKIMDNFYTYYINKSNYNSTSANVYYSVIRYFFDVYDVANKITYTGMGNLMGDYTSNYYDKFVSNTNNKYTVPNEIQTETVNLMNPNFEYYLNYYSRYLLLNATGSKPALLSFIIKLAHILRASYNNIDISDGTGKEFYSISSNPFPNNPNKARQSNSNISNIITKVKSKTFKDYDSKKPSSGSTPTKDTTNVLNNIVDRKYFVAYLTAIKQAIKNPDKNALSKVDENANWDPTNLLISDDSSKSMLLTDEFRLDMDPNNMYYLMDYFGEFDKRTNTYKINSTGLIVLKQLSEDNKKIIYDYLDRMCILAFTPVKYGGEVNYDRWMFYK